ncbi:L-threonylcarbamoyladenylate synthase [Haploplasma axanthum]|uniref:L-threonylcarbamoyladenylate synthase n=1 Tax=Haploplasma axanthum TaxID=29552 RepID=A0A449BCR6_HAPAX|nr:L-threonylcarbamoyladenylate synthase [Haploplasma axanthum]VEU80243.1 t(6)A37 threonylcarbamoyladenosine biosynthesis protein RimN [Haploplasma axanthum]
MKNNLIIFPTDTVYGIGTTLYDTLGINKIYEIKGRDFNKPIAVLCANLEQIERFAKLTDLARLIGQRFWPGGLTLILETTEEYYEKTGEKTIGVRIPNHKLALEILNENGPMKVTSINQSGEPPLNDYEIIFEKYNNVVKKIYKNNETIQEVASTVISLVNNFEIIREGNITKNDILEVLKSLEA